MSSLAGQTEGIKEELVVVANATSFCTTDSGDVTKEEVTEMIDGAMELYSADKTGMVDFALKNSGGRHMCTRVRAYPCQRTCIFNCVRTWASV